MPSWMGAVAGRPVRATPSGCQPTGRLPAALYEPSPEFCLREGGGGGAVGGLWGGGG